MVIFSLISNKRFIKPVGFLIERKDLYNLQSSFLRYWFLFKSGFGSGPRNPFESKTLVKLRHIFHILFSENFWIGCHVQSKLGARTSSWSRRPTWVSTARSARGRRTQRKRPTRRGKRRSPRRRTRVNRQKRSFSLRPDSRLWYLLGFWYGQNKTV